MHNSLHRIAGKNHNTGVQRRAKINYKMKRTGICQYPFLSYSFPVYIQTKLFVIVLKVGECFVPIKYNTCCRKKLKKLC